MYYLQMSGYGYRKRICESVTDWFMNRYMPRHSIGLRIIHRGLKRELVYDIVMLMVTSSVLVIS